MSDLNIDFSEFGGTVYTGRARGEDFRKKLQLDKVDGSSESQRVFVKIPSNTYSVTSSFFLGLFGPSVIKAGSKDKFYQKYKFEAPDFLMPEMDTYIARALRDKNLFA